LKRPIVLLLAAVLLLGCGGAEPPADSAGLLSVVEGPYRVHLISDPMPPRVGQPVTFTITVEDAATGQPAEQIEVRPVADMTMPDQMGMMAQLSAPEEVAPGQFQTTTIFDHEGTLRVTVSIARERVVTPVSFPEMQVQR
jgi:hypothetical protein